MSFWYIQHGSLPQQSPKLTRSAITSSPPERSKWILPRTSFLSIYQDFTKCPRSSPRWKALVEISSGKFHCISMKERPNLRIIMETKKKLSLQIPCKGVMDNQGSWTTKQLFWKIHLWDYFVLQESPEVRHATSLSPWGPGELLSPPLNSVKALEPYRTQCGCPLLDDCAHGAGQAYRVPHSWRKCRDLCAQATPERLHPETKLQITAAGDEPVAVCVQGFSLVPFRLGFGVFWELPTDPFNKPQGEGD